MKKRLAIDARGIDDGLGAGIAHASRELIQELKAQAEDFQIEIVTYTRRGSGFHLRQRLKKDRINHIFVASGAVSPFLSGTFYPWVHDLAIFEHPEWFPQSSLKRLLTTNLFLFGLGRAKHIFAVSEDTKRALMRIAHVTSEKVSVTYQGIKKSSYECRISGPYALILGTLEPRKNIQMVDAIWPEILKHVPNARLIVAGRNGWGDVQIHHAERVMDFDDTERDKLLASASMLLIPSLHEGFGRTALEALSLGVPVIASDRGALPEIVGEAGRLIDAVDVESWQGAIVDAFQGKMDGGKGIAQSGRFSWECTARTILAKIVEDW